MKDQKTVVVTGCTKGLGRAMAEGFLKRGWNVAGCGRSGSEGEFFFRQVDVANAEVVQGFAGEVIAEVGLPDLVINNSFLILH